ncbi:colanic acid biosynthesis glycosyltransferase WcaL [Salipiger sp. IMCC34102]|uniref:glycosyltransferase n=1 Tax=Salipiger sp. IMCC34102 TaxID=2510647 RepID=UPI00101D9DAA|nr:glycosyltransferase [Salipiger sp. IMCC34102]RYH01219.1 colanic acid biosynthesis glycosyltransferase WcaL [Salipiger sp. IMCC34102]
MKIGYVINSYPMPSHSFIRREILALERQGVEVARFAMRTDRDRLVDPGDLAELDKTELVLERAGSLGLARSLLGALSRDPRRFAQALRLAVTLGRRSDRGVLRHLIYLGEASYLLRRFAQRELTHAHAHFGTNSTSVVLLMHKLGGPAYSFTVHGPEEFDAPTSIGLPIKLAHCAFAVGVSAFGRSQLCRWTDPDGWDKLKIVHCGIDPTRFEEPVPLPGGALRVISIGRFVEQKGQLVLLDALARHRAAGGHATLTLVGDGPMRALIEARIATLSLKDAVTLTGWVSEGDVEELIGRSHLLAMSSFAEGLPMVMMEAMAMGRPVLGTYIAGIPELVTPETGWLVPASDAEAMASALDRIAAAGPQVWARMGTAARARALARHDIDREAARIAQHIRAAAS